MWRQAVATGDDRAPDLRSWELALAFAVRDALRSGDLYLAEIVKGLEASVGAPVAREDLARVSPLAHAHVIPSGTYHFDRAGERAGALP